MSFASEVKKELVRVTADACCMRTELSAILKISGDLMISNSKFKIEFKSTNPAIARRLVSLVKKLYNASIDLKVKKWMKLKKKNMYIVIIVSHVDQIIKETNFLVDGNINRLIDKVDYKKECCTEAFLRGSFLCKGSVNSPYTSSYHLEIETSYEELSEDISTLLNNLGLSSKVIQRRNNFLIYIKKVEKISDFLRIIKATEISFFYENIRIERDMKYQIKRLNNVEVANTYKTLKSSNTQIDQIKIIKEYYKNNIPKKFEEIITLRELYLEASLQELSNKSISVLGKHLSKSGINHRFREMKKKISEIEGDVDE